MLELLQPLPEMKMKGVTETGEGGQGKKKGAGISEEGAREERAEGRLVYGSSLQASLFQVVHISQRRLQMFSSKAHVQLNSIQPGRRSLFSSNRQHESKHNQTW